MSRWTASRRDALKGVAATLGLAGLPTARGQEEADIAVTIDPKRVVLAPGESATVDIVVRGGDRGVDAFRGILVELESSVASVESYSLTRGTPFDRSRIHEDGQTLELDGALLDNTHPGAAEIAIAQATIRANGPGRTVAAVTPGLVTGDSKMYDETAESGTVIVESGMPPAASLDLSPSSARTGESITFDASESTGGVVEFRWDFDDDGTVDTTTALPATNHTYEEPGERTVALEVEDRDGRTARTTGTVIVKQRLRATLDVSPTRIEVGETVTLDASESTGDIVEYRWDFEENFDFEFGETTTDPATAHTHDEFDETTTDPATAHTYDEPGERTLTLEVEDSEGQTATTRSSVVVEPPDEPLSAVVGWTPAEPDTGRAVSFDATESTGNIVEYRWDFDASGQGFFDKTTAEPTASHTYEEPDEKTIILEVLDSDGQTDRAEETLAVDEDDDLSVTLEYYRQPTDGAFSFIATGASGDIVEHRWDFHGDGVFDTTTADPGVSNRYEESGEHTVVVEVVDSDGRTARASETVVAEPTTMEAAFDWTPDRPESGQEITFDASESGGATDSITEFRWDFDGDDSFETTTNSPTTGHTYEGSGTRVVELTVTGIRGRRATVERTVEVRESSSDGEGPGDDGGRDDGHDDSGEKRADEDSAGGSGENETDDRTDSGNSDPDNGGDSDNDGGDGDGSGSGFGVGSALAGLGGAGYLLKRRLVGDGSGK